jgi:hypothetical protein
MRTENTQTDDMVHALPTVASYYILSNKSPVFNNNQLASLAQLVERVTSILIGLRHDEVAGSTPSRGIIFLQFSLLRLV